MATKQRKHRKPGKTISLAVVAGFAPLTLKALYWWNMGANTSDKVRNATYSLVESLTGFDPNQKKFFFAKLAEGWLPILTGTLLHAAANRLGINRVLSRAGVPLFRV